MRRQWLFCERSRRRFFRASTNASAPHGSHKKRKNQRGRQPRLFESGSHGGVVTLHGRAQIGHRARNHDSNACGDQRVLY